LSKSLGVYFGSKRVGTVTNGATANFTQDRLGSNGTYYPYGEARGSVPQDDVGYATYTNDSATGLEYADQRYYASNFGRFMSVDRTWYGTDSSRPASWNRYSYVEGDPVTYNDPFGMYQPPPPPAPPPPPPVPDPDPSLGGSSSGSGSNCLYLLSRGVGSSGRACPGINFFGGNNFNGAASAMLPQTNNLALAALASPGCLSLFETPQSLAAGVNPVNVFNALFGAVGTPSVVDGYLLQSNFVASWTVLGKDAITFGPGFTIGVFQGNFFAGEAINVSINRTEFADADASLDAAVLLHELGHVLNDMFSGASQIQDDGTSNATSQANTTLILSKCGLQGNPAHQ